MDPQATNCRNCGYETLGAYCQNCGQRSSIHKVTFIETGQDFINAVFSVDAPFFTTLKGLFLNPGRMLREYLDGRRKRYYKPVAFFILITIIYLLVRALIGFDPFKNSTVSVQDETVQQLLMQARDFMLLNIDKFLFLFVFAMGVLLKLFFWKRRTLAEFTAISFYLVAVYSIFTTLNMFVVQFISSRLQFLAMFIMLSYFCYAMISFFQRQKLLVLIKSVVIFSFGIMTYGFTAFALSYLIVYLKQL